MAPKALTNCPDNLREAIDWLVQVKHCGGVSTLSDALASLFDNVAQDAEEALSSLLDTDRPSARDVVSKLRAFQSTLPEDSENPNKNIIHNLCTSAGSLLGYRYPGTYDGSGIVYGDASRLCDAILAFLYAVFSDVHDNQPYVAGRSVLRDVVVQLKSQLWRGHKGFCQGIPKVASGLQRYNAAVEASNDRVKKPIETVLEYVQTDGELCRGIQALQISETSTSTQDERTVESAVSLVEECKEVARVFSKSLTAATDAIDDLNPKLKRKIENARKSFFNHVDWLSKWSKKGQKKKLDKMIQKINTRVRQLAKAVKDKIKQEVRTVVELLKKRVREIRIKLEGITASLEKYVKELGTWMGEAKEYIKQVREYVNKIMEQLDGENKQSIDEAAGEIDRVLSQKVEALNGWIERADSAVQAAKKKADEVHRRLEHNNQGVHKHTSISKGIQQISAAKRQVEEVDKGLKDVNTDLEKWREAAKIVLDIAVGKAEEVHKQLDPKKNDEKHPIGQKLNEIDTANEGIISANKQLGEQVKSLNKWIETAERIRNKAEQKAKEAYEKLDVHEDLSKNVKKIVEAKDKINLVHSAVDAKVKELGRWKAQAEEVIGGAVEKAEEVWNGLQNDANISKNVEEIKSTNGLIKAASEKLATEVQNLDKWNTAAKDVIKKVEDKCDDILKKVSKDGKPTGVIYEQAELLRDNGKKLLTAADQAKKKVEEKVKDALKAVKAMDTDLKKDLFDVKKKIKEGIKDVISELKINDLGETVKQDLEQLRERISDLSKGLAKDGKYNPIVEKALKDLDQANRMITVETSKIKTETEKQLVENFNNNIQKPLDKKVKAVDEAIVELYKKFEPDSVETKDKINDVIGHIHAQVGNILRGDQPNRGLEGIAAGLVQEYAGAFVNGKFESIVQGWVDDILGNKDGKKNVALKAWIEKYVKAKNGGSGNLTIDKLRVDIITQIKREFRGQMTAAGQVVAEEIGKANGNGSKITTTVSAVKAGCQKFVYQLDEKFFDNGGLVGIAGNISRQIHVGHNNHKEKQLIAEVTLIALRSAANQVADEIESILLGDYRVGKTNPKTSIAKELDRVIDVTKDLDGKLAGATTPPSTGEESSETGTAQAVDKAIGDVKNMVDKTIKDTFEKEVKKPVEDAVKGLDSAVEAYDKSAQEQVKKAAQTAIGKAAEEISTRSDVELSEAMGKMRSFNQAYSPIKHGLETHLNSIVDKQLPSKTDYVDITSAPGFANYTNHTARGHMTNYPYGKLPEAIETIGSKATEAFNDNGVRSILEKGDSSFTGPFETIKKQLDDIAGLVGKEPGEGIIPENADNLKYHLKTLNAMLNNGPKGMLGIDNTLTGVHEELENLQSSTFGTKPEKIEEAVKAVKAEVEVLKKKLKSSDKNDVINRLENLKNDGLGKGDWNNNVSGEQTCGLAKIENELKRHTAVLGMQPVILEKAVGAIQWEIFRLGFKLQNIFTDNDILDNLRKLGRKIGRVDVKDGNNLLQMMQGIRMLWAGKFSKNPNDINLAAGVIRRELKQVQHVLEGDTYDGVIGTLKDLKDVGLSKNVWEKVEHNKGHQLIESYLKYLQTKVSQQPSEIDGGVEKITQVLDELRTALKGGNGHPKDDVINRLEDLREKGLGDKPNSWDGKDGLGKIKTGIDDLKNFQLRQVTDKLVTLFGDIQHAAAYADWHISQLDNPHIDKKLKGIESGLNTLRLTDLAEAISMCDDFLIKADEIERNTVHALWKHVDDEVGDAIEDLTKQARTLYVDSVREALELFVKKVNEDLEQLPGDINHDLKIGFKGFMNTVEGENSENINKLKCVESRELKLLSAELAGFFGTVNDYVRQETVRLHDEQNKAKNPFLPPTEEPYTLKLNDVYKALTALLAYLRDNDGGTERLTELIERLTKALGNLVPADFKHPSTPLLDTVTRGLSKFADEFVNTYISAYSGQRCREEHAHKYAKVLLSMIPMTHKALSKLMMKCENEWKHLHITEFTADDRDNALGNYLTRCGYRVSSSESGQDGELNNMFTGAGIHELLTTRIEDVAIEMHLGAKPLENEINLVTMVAFLYNVLCHYFQVCHISVPPYPRYPCTVRDMLSWLSGLQYTQVADNLPDHCKALLNRRCHDGDIPNKDDPVMARCIGELPSTIASTCSQSTALLTAIQGNGHGFDLVAYPYSVDFSNNRAGLHYPNDPAELLDMLREIVCRLCKVLYFLYSQCCRSTARVNGWRECTYGRQVQSHNWQCGQFHRDSTNSATTAATTNTTTATTSSTTTTKHGCPPTSPLQSFLSDSCHGLLPHTLTTADMTIHCANCTSNQPGQQCLTPLGFWDLGFAASISGTGWDLAKRLGDMCRDADSCVFVLCRTLSLLCPTAPSSLADVFAFYAQMLRKWDPHDRVDHRGGAYTDASNIISHLNTDGIDSLFPLGTQLHGSYRNYNLITAISSLAGHDHKIHDALSSLFNDSTCKSPSGCAPYLQPLGLHAHHTYPQKHAGLYITWIMYLAWQFWELLYNLLHALGNIDCTASGCATCPCQLGTHGGNDTCHCPSLVHCAGPLPTLYRYGFTYPNANLLVTDNRAMRCGDLNAQLKEALHSDHFTELFRQIDQLIWHIRMPFLYFLIALWYLVALYILHTFLYRLDILHIRSHLIRTKASHRIDVKALLTKGRKMLSLYKDVDYFDDDPSELLNIK